jgi:hypothetical protein
MSNTKEREALAAEAIREALAKLVAQAKHLIDDITYCANPDDPTRRYVMPGKGLMFSNLVNALVSDVAAAERALAQQPQAAAGERNGLPRHQFWGAGEPACPADLLAPNGELHTSRCKVCGDGWRKSEDVCFGVEQPATSTEQEPNEDQRMEFVSALEVRRALRIVETVSALPVGGRDADMPTPFHSGFQLACEEIQERLRTEIHVLPGGLELPIAGPLPSAAQPDAAAPPPAASPERVALAQEAKQLVTAAFAAIANEIGTEPSLSASLLAQDRAYAALDRLAAAQEGKQ